MEAYDFIIVGGKHLDIPRLKPHPSKFNILL